MRSGQPEFTHQPDNLIFGMPFPERLWKTPGVDALAELIVQYLRYKRYVWQNAKLDSDDDFRDFCTQHHATLWARVQWDRDMGQLIRTGYFMRSGLGYRPANKFPLEVTRVYLMRAC